MIFTYKTGGKRRKAGTLTAEERKSYMKAYAEAHKEKTAEYRAAYRDKMRSQYVSETVKRNRRCRSCGERCAPVSYYYCSIHYTYGNSYINDVG